MILSCAIGGKRGNVRSGRAGEGGPGSGGREAPPNRQARWCRNRSKRVVIIGNMDIIGRKWVGGKGKKS